jgi:hypothetical protein
LVGRPRFGFGLKNGPKAIGIPLAIAAKCQPNPDTAAETGRHAGQSEWNTAHPRY